MRKKGMGIALTDAELARARVLWKDEGLSVLQIVALTGRSESVLYRHLGGRGIRRGSPSYAAWLASQDRAVTMPAPPPKPRPAPTPPPPRDRPFSMECMQGIDPVHLLRAR